MSYRRRFNLDEVLREWAAEQVATSRDQRDPRRSGEDGVASADGAAEEDEVRQQRAGHTHQRISDSQNSLYCHCMINGIVQQSKEGDAKGFNT